MPKKFDSFYTPFAEKDEHKKSKMYKKLSPKLRDAVDDIFKKMDTKPSDFLNTFDKTIKQVSKKRDGFKISKTRWYDYCFNYG